MTTLLDNQSNAIAKLERFKVGALFMEAGTGKTRAALELVQSVIECDYVLWLTPYQVKNNLREELSKWTNRDIRIEGIESLSGSDALYLELTATLSAARCPFVVVDESLKIKNWDAKRTRHIIELGKLSTYKLILNGTPISRNILDIWAQMEFLSPRILNMSSAQYKNTFCEIKRVTRVTRGRSSDMEFITAFHNVDYLYSLIEPYVYECSLQLKSKRKYISKDYTLDDETRQQYNEIKQHFLSADTLELRNNNIFIEMTTKLQHTYSCTPDKIKVLSEIVESNTKKKVIVFCRFYLSACLVQHHFKNVTVLTYGKHSFGLNLQDHSVVVFFDKTWDYAQRIQAERRVWREGQTDNCTFYDLTANVGLDSMININIGKKQGLLEHFKKVGAEQFIKEL